MQTRKTDTLEQRLMFCDAGHCFLAINAASVMDEQPYITLYDGGIFYKAGQLASLSGA